MKRATILLAISVVTLLSLAQAALAATVGDDLAVAPDVTFGDFIAPTFTWMMDQAPGSVGALYAFPQNGTVTALRVRVGPGPGTTPKVIFKLLRPTADPTKFTVLASTSGQQTAPFSQITTIPDLCIPVQANDTFAINVEGNADFFLIDANPTAKNRALAGNPLTGSTATFGAPTAGVRMTMNADFDPSSTCAQPPAPPATTTPDTSAPAAQFSGLKNGKTVKPFREFGGTFPSDATRVDFALQQALADKSKAAASAKSRKKRCKNLKNTSTKFSNAGSCTVSRLNFFSTTFATPGKWIFDLKRNLKPGSYNAFVRAADASGNVDSTFSSAKGNKVSFEVARAAKR